MSDDDAADAATSGPIVEVLPVDAWAGRVAGLLADRLATKPDLVVALPTGTTPLPVYERLPAALTERGVTAGAATLVVLDEYLGLPAAHAARCDEVLRRTVVRRLQPRPGFIPFDVDHEKPEEACAGYDDAIRRAGGLDLVVLGLGRNGHLGMNEPGTDPAAPTRAVELASATREAARGYGTDPPPTHGVTLGMAAILAAPEVWLLATGRAKADILAATLHGPITQEVPASLLRVRPTVRVLADADAAGPPGR